MYDLEKFKNEDVYIKLETQEKYNKVMEWLEEKGVKWENGELPTFKSWWFDEGETTSITHGYNGGVGMQYTREQYYKKNGYTELLPSEKGEEMKLGDKVKFGTINKIHDSGEFYLVDDTWYHVDDIKPHKFVGQRYKVIEDRFEEVEPGDIVELVKIFDNKCSMYERVRDRRRVALLDIDYPTPEVELVTTMDILKVGMLVELRNGTIYVVLPNTSIYEGEFMFVANNGFMSLDGYDEYGNYEYDYDIVKIYDNTKLMGAGLFTTGSREVLYERGN